jgi:hypothetical protein
MSEMAVYVESGGGNFVSQYNPEIFIASSDQTKLLIRKLELAAIAIGNAIDGIYTNVGNLSIGWEGKDHDDYVRAVVGYRPYLETFLFFIKAYTVLLEQLDGNIDDLYTTIDDLLNI